MTTPARQLSAGAPRVALVGISGYGRILLAVLRDLAERGVLALSAAVVINPAEENEACARLLAENCRLYTSVEAMLTCERGRLELCLLPVPIHHHRELVEKVLAAGINVLVEKPLAPTLDEADAIVGAAARSQQLVAVGFQDLYRPEVHALKRRLLNGELGTVTHLDARVFWPRTGNYYARNDWAGHLRVAGLPVFDSPLNNAAAHFLMLMLFLAGPGEEQAAEPVSVAGDLVRAQCIESFDTAAVRFEVSTGARVLLLATHSCAEEIPPAVRIRTERATIDWAYEGGFTVRHASGEQERVCGSDLMHARSHMIRQVIARLHDPGVFVVSPRLARVHAACIADVHQRLSIRQVDEADIETVSTPSGLQRAIRGIERHWMRCWELSALPGEVSCREGSTVRLATKRTLNSTTSPPTGWRPDRGADALRP